MNNVFQLKNYVKFVPSGNLDLVIFNIQVIDHYENPRNVGSLDKSDNKVGTGLVGAPACGDVMKLQIKVKPCFLRYLCYWCQFFLYQSIEACHWARNVIILLSNQVDDDGRIVDAKFKTFGCGSAIASSSLATEWVKGKTVSWSLICLYYYSRKKEKKTCFRISGPSTFIFHSFNTLKYSRLMYSDFSAWL